MNVVEVLPEAVVSDGGCLHVCPYLCMVSNVQL